MLKHLFQNYHEHVVIPSIVLTALSCSILWAIVGPLMFTTIVAALVWFLVAITIGEILEYYDNLSKSKKLAELLRKADKL